MTGTESIGGFSANRPATERSSTIRTQPDSSKIGEKITEKIHGKVDEKLKSAGVSLETREALLADLTQEIQGQLSSGGQPDPKAMKEKIGGIFEKHGLSLPEGLQGGPARFGSQIGSTGFGTAGSPQFDAIQSLIENLQAAGNESRDNEISANQYASNLLNGLLGFDVEA